MRITKRQLRKLVQEAVGRAGNFPGPGDGAGAHAPVFDEVMQNAVELFGQQVELDEEADGNLVVILDPGVAEAEYAKWIKIWPEGEMIEDGIATGVYEE